MMPCRMTAVCGPRLGRTVSLPATSAPWMSSYASVKGGAEAPAAASARAATPPRRGGARRTSVRLSGSAPTRAAAPRRARGGAQRGALISGSAPTRAKRERCAADAHADARRRLVDAAAASAAAGGAATARMTGAAAISPERLLWRERRARSGASPAQADGQAQQVRPIRALKQAEERRSSPEGVPAAFRQLARSLQERRAPLPSPRRPSALGAAACVGWPRATPSAAALLSATRL